MLPSIHDVSYFHLYLNTSYILDYWSVLAKVFVYLGVCVEGGGGSLGYTHVRLSGNWFPLNK